MSTFRMALFVCLIASVCLSQTALDTSELKIVVLEGEDGVNIIKDKTAVKPVVEVRDKNNLPVAGALVYFLIPKGGAGGAFANGQQSVSVTTDAAGRAVASSIKPSGAGPFNIEVRASYQGRAATTTIRQTNFPTVQAAQQAGKTPGSSQSASNSSSASSGSSPATSATSATSAASASTATTASSAVGASSSGMSGLAIAGIAGGVAAAGAGAYYTYATVKDKVDEGPNCDSQFNAVMSSLNNFGTRCGVTSSDAQCNAAGQSLLDTVGRMCSCFGGVGLDSETRSLFQQVVTSLRQAGFNTTQYASCGQ